MATIYRDTLQERNLEKVDRHALSVSWHPGFTLQDLAYYLTSPFHADWDRARAIFRWIAENISYDADLSRRRYSDQSPEAVLRSGQGVCEGYSRLFAALGELASLQVVTITGWARSSDDDWADANGEPNHMWNAVRVDSTWHLLDVTWGAGQVDDPGDFIRCLNEHYFLTPPEQFIYTHLPEDRSWQLLSGPLSKSEFSSLPAATSAFWKYGLRMKSHAQGRIRAGGDLTVTVLAPKEVLMIGALSGEDGTDLEGHTLTQRYDDTYETEVIFPAPGHYGLDLFARDSDNSTGYEHVLGYQILSGGGGRTSNCFPETYAAFLDCGAYLYEPMERDLETRSSTPFTIRVPGAVEVTVVASGEWHHLVRRGEMFRGDVQIEKGEVTVYARFPREQRWRGLLGYRA